MNDVDFVFLPLRKFQGAMKLFSTNSYTHFSWKWQLDSAKLNSARLSLTQLYSARLIHIAHTVVYHGAGSSKVITSSLEALELRVVRQESVSHHVRSK